MKEFLDSKHLGSFIGDSFCLSDSNTVEHQSIVTNKTLVKMSHCQESDVQNSIKFSVEGFQTLKELGAYKRSEILLETAKLLRDHCEDIAPFLSHEMGKTITNAINEVHYTANYFVWFAEEAKRIYGKIITSNNTSKRVYKMYFPIGPCFFVTPWNFPLAMAGRKIASAIAAGCSTITKPCKEAPMTMLALAHIMKKAGAPKGTVQVLIGKQEVISPPLLSSYEIRKVSFTGSVEVGKFLYKASSDTLKKVTMELGGNAPFIVFDDANLDVVMEGALGAKTRNNGQTCVSANRFLVQEKIHDAFIEALTKTLSKLKIGDPFDKSSDLSTILHPTSKEKAQTHLEDGLKRGAKKHLDAKEAYQPQILSKVSTDMLAFTNETFGPLVAVTLFKSKEEALKLANSTQFGLASYVFTESLSTADYMCQGLEFGMVGLNDGAFSSPEVPFGGVKDSGFGREGGDQGIYEFLTDKIVSQKL